jgi:hypothetical protein
MKALQPGETINDPSDVMGYKAHKFATAGVED